MFCLLASQSGNGPSRVLGDSDEGGFEPSRQQKGVDEVGRGRSGSRAAAAVEGAGTRRADPDRVSAPALASPHRTQPPPRSLSVLRLQGRPPPLPREWRSVNSREQTPPPSGRGAAWAPLTAGRPLRGEPRGHPLPFLGRRHAACALPFGPTPAPPPRGARPYRGVHERPAPRRLHPLVEPFSSRAFSRRDLRRTPVSRSGPQGRRARLALVASPLPLRPPAGLHRSRPSLPVTARVGGPTAAAGRGGTTPQTHGSGRGQRTSHPSP